MGQREDETHRGPLNNTLCGSLIFSAHHTIFQLHFILFIEEVWVCDVVYILPFMPGEEKHILHMFDLLMCPHQSVSQWWHMMLEDITGVSRSQLAIIAGMSVGWRIKRRNPVTHETLRCSRNGCLCIILLLCVKPQLQCLVGMKHADSVL